MRRRLIAIVTTCAVTACGLGARALAAEPEPTKRMPPTAATGEVVGSVSLAIAGDRVPPMLSPYARRRYAPPAAPQSSASPENVVVYIVVEGTPSPRAMADVTILQRDRTILPHTTAVRIGTRINFPNLDAVFHNLFSLSAARPFNLGRYAPGSSRTETFDRLGIVRVFCDIHSEMSGTIVVLDTPYFTKPDENGEYRIRDVPEGRHTLFAWHESAGTTSTEIIVSAHRPTRADIRLPR